MIFKSSKVLHYTSASLYFNVLQNVNSHVTVLEFRGLEQSINSLYPAKSKVRSLFVR